VSAQAVGSRESAAVKGRRYLTEGRLTVEHVVHDVVVASCRGDSGETYKLGYDPARQDWDCSCPARTRCSHLVALMLVTVRASGEVRA
jgi:uncharacterized Zn finger protein